MTVLAQSSPLLELHLPAPVHALVEQAAALKGQEVQEFATYALAESAQRVVQQHGQTILSDTDRDLFLALLDSEAEPNAALKEAARRFRERHV